MAKRTQPPVRARLRPRLPQDLPEAQAPDGDEDIEWDGVAVTGVDLLPRVETLSIRAAHLKGVRFTGVRVERLEASDTVIEDCELSGAVLAGARLQRVELRRCRMAGVDLSRSTLDDVLLDGCRLDEANLRGATLRQVDVDDCELRAADLYGARIERSNLLRSNLTGADFSKATLQRVLLHGSDLVDVQGGASLTGAIVSRDQVLALAPALITALGILVDDDFEDAATPR